MNKTMIAVMVVAIALLIGCQPMAPPAAPAPAEPSVQPVTTAPAATEAAPAAVETAPAPMESAEIPPREGFELAQVCYELMSPETFSSVCGTENTVVLTPKISEASCWVNIADHANNKLTGGFTVVDWKKPEKAGSEFDRGVKARIKQGSVEGRAVGDRSYEYDELARHNIVWQSGNFLTQLGVMTALCPADKLPALAQSIESHLV